MWIAKSPTKKSAWLKGASQGPGPGSGYGQVDAFYRFNIIA